jgi:hypothetical protein
MGKGHGSGPKGLTHPVGGIKLISARVESPAMAGRSHVVRPERKHTGNALITFMKFIFRGTSLNLDFLWPLAPSYRCGRRVRPLMREMVSCCSIRNRRSPSMAGGTASSCPRAHARSRPKPRRSARFAPGKRLPTRLWFEGVSNGKTTHHYRPELHYMRGPGPKWHEKHAGLPAPVAEKEFQLPSSSWFIPAATAALSASVAIFALA